MPTKKPRIQAIVTEETYMLFKKLCNEEQRSESNYAGYIITKYIDELPNYENETSKQALTSILDNTLLNAYNNADEATKKCVNKLLDIQNDTSNLLISKIG